VHCRESRATMELHALNLNHKQEWAGLLAECFGRKQSETETLLDWLYQLFEPVAWGVWEDNRLVAQYTALKRPLAYQGAMLATGMSVNMAVHPGYRGRGYIKKMAAPVYESLQADGVCFGMGFSNAEGVQVDKHSKGYGYHVVGQMRPLFAPLLPSNAPKLYLTPHFPDDCLVPYEMLPALGFPKDCDYIYQRYAAHPFRQYQFALWQESAGTLGMVVYRPVRLMGISAVSILDVWGEDLPELLRRFSATASQQGYRLVQALVSPVNPLQEAFHWNWLSPFARNPYYLTLKPMAEGLSKDFDDFQKWQLIGGDVL
jgi:GNAT superfamily N-acetyltransferase